MQYRRELQNRTAEIRRAAAGEGGVMHLEGVVEGTGGISAVEGPARIVELKGD